jgi:outer membrane autotransporter protein
VTFSEAVSGFTLAAVTVTNGSATGLSGSGASYSLVVTPDGSGDITIQVANGAAVNALGNESMGASATTALLQAPGTITIVKTTAPYGAGDGTFVYTSVDPDLDGVAITTSGQTGSVTVSKPAGLFEITENVESTWSLTSVSCSETIASNSVAVLADRKVTIQLEAGENVTCTFVSGRESDYVVGRTQRLISNFMARRADQMTASEPDLVQRMSNDCGGSADPLAVSGSGTSNSNTISMATNLQQLLVQNKAAKMPREDPEGGARPSSSDRSSACTRGPGVWVEGRWAHVANEMAKTDLGLLYVGIDYRLAEDFLFGLLTQFDWTRERDLAEGTDVAGFGWLTGPYVVARINRHLYFDARVAVGQSKNTVSPLESYTDEFDTDRWLVRSRLTGDFEWDGWRVSPELGIVYLDESQRRYVDNLGIVIPGQTVTLGRMTLGPTVGTTFEVPDIATISPQLKLSGIWDFDRTELVSVETGSPAASQKLRGRVEGGISANFGNGVSLTLEGFYDGIGLEQYDAYGGATRLSIQLN